MVKRDAGEVLVPLAAEICRSVDTAGKRIVIDPPEGLLEVNEARKPEAEARRGTAGDVDIVTIFPAMVEAALAEGVVGRAIERAGCRRAGARPADFTTTGTASSTTCRTAAGRGWC